MPKIRNHTSRREKDLAYGFDRNWYKKYTGKYKWMKIAELALGKPFVKNRTTKTGPNAGCATDDKGRFMTWKIFVRQNIRRQTVREVTVTYWAVVRIVEQKRLQRLERQRQKDTFALDQTLNKMSSLQL